MPFLSVVMPVYNVEKYVGQAIESVLDQPCKDLELIIVDDGSPDDSGRICDEYASKDSRVTVIHKENEGVSVARNTGIDVAKGKYIAFLDSDDVWTTGFYDKDVYDLLNKQEYKAYIFKYCFTDADLNVYGYPSGKCKNENALTQTDRFIFCIDSFVVDLDHIRSIPSIFIPGCNYYEDVLFESNAIHNINHIFLDKIMALYRQHSASISHIGLTTEKKYFSAIKGRIWYSEFYKGNNPAFYKMNYACIFGGIYEYLSASFLTGASVKHVERELTDAGFAEYYQNYRECSIPDDMKKKLDEYFKNKQLFRLKWYIRGIARRIMRRK